MVEDIGHDSLALTWKPPVWDGGSNITNYVVEKREHPMSSWIRVGNTRSVVTLKILSFYYALFMLTIFQHQ